VTAGTTPGGSDAGSFTTVARSRVRSSEPRARTGYRIPWRTLANVQGHGLDSPERSRGAARSIADAPPTVHPRPGGACCWTARLDHHAEWATSSIRV
jgi:hypothetical protein